MAAQQTTDEISYAEALAECQDAEEEEAAANAERPAVYGNSSRYGRRD